MMVDPVSFRKALENATLKEIIKERDKLIREIRRYEKGKILEEECWASPSPEMIYFMNNLYLAELCYLINEKDEEKDEY
ncbi:MAG: hypothetical protein E7Z77_09535 [Methanobrevibacter sp.]|uniref:hypothetical protein n=1 Tax=Methanobrevibacter sp. TaxID=66852 RepID=UPI0025D64FD7|nr:hypothetical protein [Methanobrevibacter sp.]MBE6509632.1 hypothetical protein [Methanobrevibacter sp.]